MIQNNGGDFIISQHTNDKDLIFKCDDGSGSTTEYFRLDGGDEKLIVSKPLNLLDSNGLKLGTGGNDFSAYHNGTDTYLDNNTGNLNIRNTADDKDIKFVCDDGSGGVETYFFLDGSANTDGNPRTKFPDNSRLMFGAGDDLDIFHDGTDSYVRNNSASGDLKIVQG